MLQSPIVSDYEERYEKLQALKNLKNNIGLFGRYCFPTAAKRTTPPFHGEIYSHIGNKAVSRVLIAAPRGTAKSTAVSLFLPLHSAAFKMDSEDLFIVIISE